jgi:putative membrane protein
MNGLGVSVEGYLWMRWLLASLHLLGFGLGLGAIWIRGSALQQLGKRQSSDPGVLDDTLYRIFRADNVWAIAAVLWVSTGLYRAFGGMEKGTAYYLNSHFFLLKMALFIGVVLLEVWPMVTLIRWRIAKGRGQPIDLQPSGAFARISRVQAVMVVLIVFLAVGMARGLGASFR